MVRSTPWVIVLAGGSGTRLHDLTTGRDGIAVPKQFCSLCGGRSLLVDTIGRALRLSPRQRIVVVVAREHERWWRTQLDCIDPQNIVVQPENRGTVAGLQLPLAHVLARDPRARVVVMPSDHHVEQPMVLLASLRQALADLRRDPDKLVLLGIRPDVPETEYGWIVPGAAHGSLREVGAFVEKPESARAAALMHVGGVWNSFLFAASAPVLWGLCRRFVPASASAIAAAVARDEPERTAALESAYPALAPVDFSRVVLGGSAAELRLRLVPECGWTDLGTPRRVADCIARIERRQRGRPARASWFPTVDLASALRRRPTVASQTA